MRCVGGGDGAVMVPCRAVEGDDRFFPRMIDYVSRKCFKF